MARGHVFRVNPRYTSGSSVVADKALAERVAAEEREVYARAVKGIYGSDRKAFAEKAGLALIVYEVKEHGPGVNVRDLITDECWFWPQRAACPKCKTRVVRCINGNLDEHNCPSLRGDTHKVPCSNREFMGRRIERF